MVLYRRKPVRIPPPKEIPDDNAEVWHIPQTGEVFTTYEDYLARMDFYNQPKFICQISGQSKLTFLEALRSEVAGAEEIEQAFPEPLKGPILRRVQFQTVSRIDSLVDMIFEEFHADYYPGEAVIVQHYSGRKSNGVIRDKTKIGSKTLPDGTQTEPSCRYSVSLEITPSEEAVVDDSFVSRDRKIFTKSAIRSFIKKTVTREAWNGAPWLVKHDYATKYHIETRVPTHLHYDSKLLERKQLQAQKRALQPGNANGVPSSAALQHSAEPMRLPELKPAPKTQKGKQQMSSMQGLLPTKGGRQNGLSHTAHLFHNGALSNVYDFPIALRTNAPSSRPVTPPPPPPPKYPIEDLQVGPRAGYVRPALKYLCMDPPVKPDRIGPLEEKIEMKSVGPLLETWDTLNVYCEIFRLDSFTFDDYVEAMCITSEQVPTQLFDEIHCSVLKIFVNPQSEEGKLEIALPKLEEEEEEEGEEGDEEEEEENETTQPTPEPEPGVRRSGRATRSSLAKLEAERVAAEIAAAAAAAAKSPEPEEPAPLHRAQDALAGFNWVEQLRKRDFKDGGWERIVVGLLYQLSKDEVYTEKCESLLGQLVPPDEEEPSQATVRSRYANLDVNHRVQILQILCMLTMGTKAIRGYMEDCSDYMTQYRKEKIDWQRQRRQALEELKVLNEERKILLPENLPASPPESEKPEEPKAAEADESMADGLAEAEDTDEDLHGRRSLRRARDRAAERQRKREEEEQERKEKAEAAKAPKQSKQFIKLEKEIRKKEEHIKRCEDEISVIDNDLREADCPRTRVLGRDRFWNRYYWFERNGMPYGGLPNSSTASARYANGCIWVQGPDDMEREGYIDLPTELQNEYKAKFNMTVPERKRREEGPTGVHNACQWGYLSEPDEVDALLEWLDPRGFNELKLRKEIVAFKDKITTHMEHRAEYLGIGGKERQEKEAEADKKEKRMSTRARQQTPEPVHYRCLSWENTTALEELGHLHSEPPPPPRAKKGSRKRDSAVSEVAAPAPKSRKR